MSKKYEEKSNIFEISDEEYLQKKEALTSFFLDNSYVKMTEKQIANFFNVPKNQVYIFDKIINELELEGKIYCDDSKRYVPIKANSSVIKCVYSCKSEKFGFGIVENGDDVFLSSDNSTGAMDGDDILVKITKLSSETKCREGIVIKILKHNTHFLIGRFEKSKNFGFVKPIDNRFQDVYIPNKYSKNIENGSVVKVNITKYATINSKAEGIIVSIIGNESEENIEIKALYESFGLDELTKVNERMIEELKNIPDTVSEKEKIGRVDRTASRVYTIDGDDAKDLDDGVFVKKDKDGNYVLSVYIADVSHYVKDGSLINEEAIKRGTSIYIPGTVIPMLPKKLSNGICSLNQGVERLSLAIDINIDKCGNVIGSNIFKAVIKVTKRMTYDKVYKVLNNSDKDVLKEYKSYIDDIFVMKELAVILKQKRINNGCIDFDIPETKVVLNENGNVIDIKPYEKTIANDIIEEFMLAANMEIAKTFYYLNAPFIYRIHEKPDEEKLRDLNLVLSNYKMRIKSFKNVKPKTLADILVKFNDKEDKEIISNYMLRALKLAKYSELCEGHFGLAARYYCHFTSPIRRYPDLFIHRVISEYISNNYIIDDTSIEKCSIQARNYAISSSEQEKKATLIERDFDEVYKVIYMQRFIGNEYECKISSITSFGMFVKLPNTVEGFVPFSLMGNDYYDYDETRKILIGKGHGKIYKIGDSINVKLERCDVSSKQIDFSIV